MTIARALRTAGFSMMLAGAGMAAASLPFPSADACCPAPRSGEAVVNADQTVLIVWDAATKTQHFIRRASFKAAGADFGFLVPTPSQPELAESGDAAFPMLAKITAPEVIRRPRPTMDRGCTSCLSRKSETASAGAPAAQSVTVLDQKTVAGFDAVVLDASSAAALTTWLGDHGYAFSPEVEAWAKPYVERGWKITALKVTRNTTLKDPTDPLSEPSPNVSAAALRLSFQTDRPLFPYREPDTSKSTASLAASHRLLRIFFVSDARYDGETSKESPWTGRVAWSGEVGAADREALVGNLGIASSPGPARWWLTEFEDPWPYRVAPADLYFARSATQNTLKRDPIIEYTALPDDRSASYGAVALIVLPILRRLGRRRRAAAPRAR